MYLSPAPLAKISTDLVNGTLDLKDYINETCDRLERIDARVESFLPEEGRRERLLKEADILQSAYPEPERRPPIYGVLIGVKDIYHAEGFLTRAGCNLDPRELTGTEADCVRLLRQAGALVLGKTVTTEFAYFDPGPSRNPHKLDHTPGGSSSGSAAAVAAGLSPLALGTQTIGSINRPAAYCGVVGFKPSYNRIPTGGLLYFSRSADHVGCFTQDVQGMILAASLLCHNWQEINVNYKPVLGLPKGRYLDQTESEALQAYLDHLDILKGSGYTVKEVSALDNIEEISLWHRKLISAEMALEHAGRYSQFAERYRPRTAEIIEEGKLVTTDELEGARLMQKELRSKLETAMRSAGIDLWVTPAATGPAPKGIEATGNPAMSLPWTNAGLPSISIPSGRSREALPLGLQFVGPFMGDELLLSWSLGIADVFRDYQAYN